METPLVRRRRWFAGALSSRRTVLTVAALTLLLLAVQVPAAASAARARTPLPTHRLKVAKLQRDVFRHLLRAFSRIERTKPRKPQPPPAPLPPPPAEPPPPPPPAPPATSANDRYGVSPDNIEFDDPATRDRTLDSLVAMGARWLRFDVKWDVIQHAGPSSYDWSRYDALVAAAQARGLKILGTLAYAPRWARSAACLDSTACEPRSASEYADWAGATVAHFKGRISHWEVWNEPNIPSFWQPQPNVARYTALLRAAYPSIKAADPSAVVLAGGTSPAANDGVRIDEVSFLQGVYANGGQGSFDAWSHHPYTHPWPPGNVHADSAWYQMHGTSPSMRSLMRANGDGHKKVWGTEYGPPTAGGPGAVSEATQAEHVTDAYRLWRSYDWAGVLFWYCDRDVAAPGASTEGWRYHGLLRFDFSAKPAWNAYRVSAATP